MFMKISSKVLLICTLFLFSSIFGSYFLSNFTNSPYNSTQPQNSSSNFSKLPLISKESVLNQTYYFWNGNYSSIFGSGNWNGKENYTLISPASYSVSERDSYSGVGLYGRNVNDMNRLIANSTNVGWVGGTHEPFWIFTNVSLGETVPVAGHTFVSGAIKPGDFNLNISKKESITHLGTQYECWKLTNGQTYAYYDQKTGFLVKGHFEFTYLSTWLFKYNISMVTTNAKSLPNIGFITPSAPILFSSKIPLVIKNYTIVNDVWCRNSSNGGISWSNNLTLSYNGSYYINSTVLHWENGTYLLQAFAKNADNLTRFRVQQLMVWTVGPYIQIISPLNITSFYRTFEVQIQNCTSVDEVWFRFKNGITWTNNITLSFNGSLFIDNTIFWADGHYHFQAFANDSIGRTSLQNQWFSVAATYPLNLSANYLTDQNARIALDSNYCIHVVWIKNSTNHFEIIYDNNVNGHFGNALTLFSSSNLLLYSANIAIDPSNTIHICWLEMTASLATNLYYTKKQGNSFSTPTSISTTGTDLFIDVSLTVDSNGKAYMALTGINLFLRRYGIYNTTNQAGAFPIPTTLYPPTTYPYNTSAIIIDSSFRVHVFWADNSTGNFDIFYKNNTGGRFAGSPERISTHRDRDSSPAVAIDSGGTLHLTWMAENNGYYDIMYVNNSGGRFHTPINVTQTPYSQEVDPRIAVDTGTNPDSIYLVWAQNVLNQLHPFIADNRKGQFCLPRPIYDPSINTTYYVDLAVHPFEGLSYIVWNGYDSNDYEMYFTEDYAPLSLLSPKNQSYKYQNIPLKVVNSSRHLTQVWCRNRTASGPWSANYTLTWDGLYFSNSSAVTWPIGIVNIQLFSNDSNSRFFSSNEYVVVDPTPPTGYQWINTTSKVIQKSKLIWINGTAWDPIPGSGIKSITIIKSNTTLGINSWSANSGDLSNFAFYNITPLADNLLHGCYTINITILDNGDIPFRISCNITIEINPPSIAQNAATQIPQNGGKAYLIWVNGTCFDSGFGVASVVIQSTNHSGSPWSLNQGTNANWAFNNISAISNGPWEIWLNATDLANNSAVFRCLIFVDYLPPSGSQSINTDINHPQNGGINKIIWVNGTGSDGSGVGILSVAVVTTNHTGNPWSVNQGTNSSWAFNNISAINEGIWQVEIQLTDKLGNSRNISCYIFVDTISPTAAQDAQTQTFQKPDQLRRIWLNGTAIDTGSGLLSVVVQGSNYTGAIWSTNLGTTTFWSFTNLTVISDGIWEIYISVTDQASNSLLLTAYIKVDTSPPMGAQDSVTRMPQNAPRGLIWINGTASDSGAGLFDVRIVATNHTGMPWSLNVGTNQSWAFTNISAINDGTWRITINLIDLLGNNRNITCEITADTNAPWGLQNILTQLPQTIDVHKLIWLNGTAGDGNGLGILNVSIVWTNSSALWSTNRNSNSSWAFSNVTSILDGAWALRINLVDRLYNSRNITCWIFVDTKAPIGLQDSKTNGSVLQEAFYIWVNGTASDSGGGLRSVSVVFGMGTNTWSPNLGTNSSWAFSNTSAIAIDRLYWVMIRVTDKAGNSLLINCTFRIEINPPQGAQNATTSLPQNGGPGHLISISGTAFDGGSGVKNASISYTNITGGAGFSNNLGTPTNWAFQNNSAIPDGTWRVIITLFDNAGHAANLSGWIIVDTIAPSKPNVSSIVSGSNVTLSWLPVVDATQITYLIYRNGLPIGNTTATTYTDLNLNPGTYNYTIVPRDAAGNIGPVSDTIFATITGGGPSNWIIIVIIIIAAGIIGVSAIAISKRKRKKPATRPAARRPAARAAEVKPPATEPKIKAIELGEVLQQKAKPAPQAKPPLKFLAPEAKVAVEEALPTLEKQKPVKEEEKLAKPKTIQFTFFCPTCKNWYAMSEFAKVNCPQCKNPLKLSYLCPKCKKRFTVKEPGMYNCPVCKDTKLIP